MPKCPLLPEIVLLIEIHDRFKALLEEMKHLENWHEFLEMENFVSSGLPISRSELASRWLSFNNNWSGLNFQSEKKSRFLYISERQAQLQSELILLSHLSPPLFAIVVSAVILLSFAYFYLIGYIDRGGSTAGSSSSLDFRDIYISIILFQAAYVWIKFRDVISLSKGAVYHRRGSRKWEPRIKYPGGTSQRLPLCSYDSFEDAEVVYRIAAFYCKKPKHRLGRLILGGGDYFHIPTFNVDPSLPYKEKVKQVGDQVLKVYAEFEEQKTSRNLSPRVLGQALEAATEEGERLTTPSIQQPQEPVNSGMYFTTQGQGSQHAPNICNGVDFDNPSSVRHELPEVYKEIDSFKPHLSGKENECNEPKQEHSEWEGLFELSQLPALDFDSELIFDMIEA